MRVQQAFSHTQQGRIDFNTVNPSLSTGMDFLIYPCRWIDVEENVRTPPKRGRYCIRTLPRGGMYWEIHPPRPERFPKGGDFAPRGPTDCPRAISRPEGCKIAARPKMPVTLEPGLKRLKFETGFFILLLSGGHFGISRISDV